MLSVASITAWKEGRDGVLGYSGPWQGRKEGRKGGRTKNVVISRDNIALNIIVVILQSGAAKDG